MYGVPKYTQKLIGIVSPDFQYDRPDRIEPRARENEQDTSNFSINPTQLFSQIQWRSQEGQRETAEGVGNPV